MTDFYKLWTDSDIGREALTDAHSYVVGDDDTTPSFPRIEAYLAAEPLRQDPEWDQWQRVKVRTLLGGERIARTGRGYTVFPADAKVNAAILGTANKFIPACIDPSTGMPCEEFRDLCNHLVTDPRGLYAFADGNISTQFLDKVAITYLKKLGTVTAATRYKLEPTNKNKRAK